jgi:hypothetical protein
MTHAGESALAASASKVANERGGEWDYRTRQQSALKQAHGGGWGVEAVWNWMFADAKEPARQALLHAVPSAPVAHLHGGDVFKRVHTHHNTDVYNILKSTAAHARARIEANRAASIMARARREFVPEDRVLRHRAPRNVVRVHEQSAGVAQARRQMDAHLASPPEKYTPVHQYTPVHHVVRAKGLPKDVILGALANFADNTVHAEDNLVKITNRHAVKKPTDTWQDLDSLVFGQARHMKNGAVRHKLPGINLWGFGVSLLVS